MSAAPSIDVAVVGEIYVDHVFSGFPVWPKPGEEVVTDAYTREIGGGAAATACGLARLGRSVSLIGLVGAIDLPWISERLRAFGVAPEGLGIGDGSTGVTISVSTTEDRSFFTHIGVNRQIGARLNSPEGLGALARARHVHFAMPLHHSVAAILLPALALAGIGTSLDMGYQPEWLADPANLPTLRAIDHLLLNEKEAELLCGSPAVSAFFDRAATIPLRHPMMKSGAQGAFLRDGSGEIASVRPPVVTARDATGAGDAFDAGFIDALLDGADAIDRLRRGCVVGALSTRLPGALAALPDKDELWSVHDRTYGS